MPPARSPRPSELHLDALRPPFAPRDATEQWLFQLQRRGIRPGLTGIRSILEGLGHPERNLPSVVVAGTNGKGTTSLCLAALCRAAGLRTALYTSPHLLRVGERLVVDGTSISPAQLRDLVEPHRDLLDRTEATFFESLTALALRWFADQGAEVAILEAGLGGRLDATNAVPRRGVVLTSIGLDHQELLGETLEEIADEKLGLAQPGVPFHVAPLPPRMRRWVEVSLREIGAPAWWMDSDGVPAAEEVGRLPLAHLAPTQRAQAALALGCYRHLAAREGWPDVDPARAFADLRTPGRWDRYGGRPELLVDTAHNDQALVTLLRHWSQARSGPRDLVLGAMRDKTTHQALRLARTVADRIWVVAPDWYRARDAADIAAELRSHPGSARVEPCGTVREGLERARIAAGAAGPGASVLVTGSNFLVAEALDRLGVDDLHHSPASSRWDEGRPLRARQPETGRAESV